MFDKDIIILINDVPSIGVHVHVCVYVNVQARSVPASVKCVNTFTYM